MRFIIKIILFISAYTPLFLIFILRYLEVQMILFWVLICILIFLNSIWFLLFKLTKKWTSKTFTVKNSVNRTSDALNYIIAYIIAFLGFQFEKWQDWIALIILLFIIFFIYINSNLIFINPILNIFGYKIQDVETSLGEHIILITKKNKLEPDTEIQVKDFSENVFLEVS